MTSRDRRSGASSPRLRSSKGLADAGTLEVAFGGGEPFAFRGFRQLIERLRRTTELALHVTTNGTLYEEVPLDMVRLSIYPGWRTAARKLVGRRWGANVLVDDGTVDALPLLLNELAALGAADVSLLTYVGPDRSYDLTRPGLDAVVRASPVPCRVSVCSGDRLPRSFGGDCGAGLDFVTLTSDRRLQSCSFQDTSSPVACAEDVLTRWRARNMEAPSSRVGCTRSAERRPTHGVRIWQGFAGNNSAECVLVARFQEIGAAERLLAELLPGFDPGRPFTAAWRELFERERVATPAVATGVAPDEMNVVGQTFIAITESTLGDDFPELRALAWKRDAFVLPVRMHHWNGSTVLFAVRANHAKHAAEITARLPVARLHGDRVVGAFLLATLADAQVELARIAGDCAVAVELFPHRLDTTDLGRALAAGPSPEKPRLALSFRNDRRALAALAPEAGAAQLRDLVLVDGLVRRKRLALRAFRRGAIVSALDGAAIEVHASFWTTSAKPDVPLTALQRAIDARLRGVALGRRGKTFVTSIETADPVSVLTALDHAARDAAVEASFGVAEIDPLAKAVARLLADV